MKTLSRGLAAGAVLTVAALAYSADAGPNVSLPDAEFKALVANDTKVVQDALSKGTPDKKAAAKAKAAAVMIAQYAQSAATPDAGLRDSALDLAKAVGEGKFDQAKGMVAKLKPGAGAGKGGTADVAKAIEIEELMNQFKPERGGGQGLEKDLQTLANKRAAYTPAEMQKVAPLAYKIAMIGEITHALAPAQNAGKKTKASWEKWSEEMIQLAGDAGKAAKAAKPDEKGVKEALKKLDASCTHCHDVFRDNN